MIIDLNYPRKVNQFNKERFARKTTRITMYYAMEEKEDLEKLPQFHENNSEKPISVL